jgi:hypothetical protein
MDKPETKANEEWTRERQRKMKNGQATDLSIHHLALSLACPFFICVCLWLVHTSLAFVSGLSILHLPLSLACPYFICLCLKANEVWTSQRQRQMKNGQTRDKGK